MKSINSVFVLTGLIFALLLVVNINLQNEMTEIMQEKEVKVVPEEKNEQSSRRVVTIKKPAIDTSRFIGRGNIRETNIIAGEEILLHEYYSEGEKVAVAREYQDKSLKVEGTIPDGKIEFTDHYKHTFGNEYYKRGKKHGLSQAFYSDGRLKIEENYFFGKLVSAKEYYDDGRVRFEVQHEDAIEDSENKLKGEVGIGKLYFPNGRLKYEWRFVSTEKTGFQKSYNQDGTLRHEALYNTYGGITLR